MMTPEQVEKLIAAGGQEWEAGSRHRVYFNEINELGGLEICRYSTGTISAASFKGRRISNSHARRLEADDSSKLWVNVKTGEIGYQNIDCELFSAATAAVWALAAITETI